MARRNGMVNNTPKVPPAAQINRSWDGVEALGDDKTDNPLSLIFGYKEKK